MSGENSLITRCNLKIDYCYSVSLMMALMSYKKVLKNLDIFTCKYRILSTAKFYYYALRGKKNYFAVTCGFNYALEFD